MRLLAAALGALLFARVGLDGGAAYQLTLTQAETVSPYDAVAQQLIARFRPGPGSSAPNAGGGRSITIRTCPCAACGGSGSTASPRRSCPST